jgi:hypothetical protein
MYVLVVLAHPCDYIRGYNPTKSDRFLQGIHPTMTMITTSIKETPVKGRIVDPGQGLKSPCTARGNNSSLVPGIIETCNIIVRFHFFVGSG